MGQRDTGHHVAARTMRRTVRRALAGVCAVMLIGLATTVAARATESAFRPAPGSPFTLPTYGAAAEFSPDGRLLAVWSEGSYLSTRMYTTAVTFFAVTADGSLRQLPGSLRFSESVFHPTVDYSLGPFTPSGNAVLVCSDDKSAATMYRVTSSGLGPALWRGHIANVYCGGTFSPDGRALATPDGDLNVYTIGNHGAARRVSGVRHVEVTWLAYSPNGGLLAELEQGALGPDSIATVPVAEDGAPAGPPLSSIRLARNTKQVLFSPQGNRLAVAGEHDVWMFNVSPDGTLTQATRQPFSVKGSDLSASFSPDGKLLAVENLQRVRVMSVGAHGGLHPIAVLKTAHNLNIGADSVVFSPTGHRLAVVNRADGTVSMFTYR